MKSYVPTLAFAALIALVLTGCTAGARSALPGGIDIRGIDFRQYAEAGFLFTPEPYQGSYETMGQVYISNHPTARRSSGTSQGQRVYGEWRVRDDNLLQAAIDSMYQVALDYGGNAVMNFQVRVSPYPYDLRLGEPSESLMRGVEVEGLVIRRTD